MRSTARQAERQLRTLADPARAAGVARFFKCGPGKYGEGDRFLGLTVPQVRTVAKECRSLRLTEVRTLLDSPWHEVRLVALLILVNQYARGAAAQQEAIYRLYLRHSRRINNWDLVDCSAGQIVGARLFAGHRVALRKLAQSRSLWERRIAMIATFYGIRRGEFGPALQVARWLRDDPHDLIHKAVGWMLREIGKRDQRIEERFLDAHAAHMPRTMLRYAIERFPERRRQHYLKQ